jgi:uncharacterized phage protein (TIGR01671 family)
MKREIKFRGKRIDNGDWIYGKVINSNFETLITQMVNAIYVDGRMLYNLEVLAYSVNSDSVGQFTGLLDKNGKEIYEGDILGWESCEGTKNQIRWAVEFSPSRGFKTWSSSKNDEIIIGNIYENPELLK